MRRAADPGAGRRGSPGACPGDRRELEGCALASEPGPGAGCAAVRSRLRTGRRGAGGRRRRRRPAAGFPRGQFPRPYPRSLSGLWRRGADATRGPGGLPRGTHPGGGQRLLHRPAGGLFRPGRPGRVEGRADRADHRGGAHVRTGLDPVGQGSRRAGDRFHQVRRGARVPPRAGRRQGGGDRRAGPGPGSRALHRGQGRQCHPRRIGRPADDPARRCLRHPRQAGAVWLQRRQRVGRSRPAPRSRSTCSSTATA